MRLFDVAAITAIEEALLSGDVATLKGERESLKQMKRIRTVRADYWSTKLEVHNESR